MDGEYERKIQHVVKKYTERAKMQWKGNTSGQKMDRGSREGNTSGQKVGRGSSEDTSRCYNVIKHKIVYNSYKESVHRELKCSGRKLYKVIRLVGTKCVTWRTCTKCN